MIHAGPDATGEYPRHLMATGTYERLTRSRAAAAFKGLLRRHAPDTTDRLQRSIRSARRAWRESSNAPLAESQQLWNPPPRRARDWPTSAGEVTNELYAKLSPGDLEVMLERLDAEDRRVWEQADESARPLLAVHFCIHYGVPGVPDRTGLTGADPPANVTAMGRGSLAAGGSLYYADLVADALTRGGGALTSKQRVLDFGCSSGRIVRVLAAVHPEIEWWACDPDAGAVRWAEANLAGIRVFVNDLAPPLPVAEEHFDAVYAIGIWTHYSDQAALRWLEEMRRIIEPGGHLVLTSHGHRSLELHAGEWGNWSADLVAEALTRLYTDGHKFFGGYGKELSVAQATPDWGEAFFTPEWLAEQVCPDWAIADYDSGRVENNHDIYVLQRRR
jgi:SAM-dependent methyltransferase